VNDLQPNATTVKYADDTTIYDVIEKSDAVTLSRTSRNHHISPCGTLQQCAQEALEWSSDNSMCLNSTKTKAMYITLRDDIMCETSLTMNNTEIETVKCFKLLGIEIDNHLQFTTHVEKTTTKARMKIHGLVVLKRFGVNPTGLLRVCIGSIRPILCYAAPAWYPYTTNNAKEKLESVQRLCLKIIFPSQKYSDTLIKVNLPSINDFLEKQCFNFVTNIKPSSSLAPFIPVKSNRPCRSNKQRYIQQAHRTALSTKNLFNKFVK
jgi:hypothetical protein